MKITAIKKYVPKPVKRSIKYALNACGDIADRFRGTLDELIPPRRINYEGHRGYVECGDAFLRYFMQLGGLKPQDKILEVGCGFGRVARPLAGFLSGEGSYTGIDIVKSGIEWLSTAYARRPNFSFQLSDVHNKTYNPAGAYDASSYKFPFANETFDFVILISVFTHMLPAEVANYLGEIARVLKRGGRCYITYFLLNEESMKAVESEKTSLSFQYALPGFRTTNRASPEDAIALDEAYVRGRYAASRLTIKEPVHYGSWCRERSKPLDLQDIVVAVKD